MIKDDSAITISSIYCDIYVCLCILMYIDNLKKIEILNVSIFQYKCINFTRMTTECCICFEKTQDGSKTISCKNDHHTCPDFASCIINHVLRWFSFSWSLKNDSFVLSMFVLWDEIILMKLQCKIYINFCFASSFLYLSMTKKYYFEKVW